MQGEEAPSIRPFADPKATGACRPLSRGTPELVTMLLGLVPFMQNILRASGVASIDRADVIQDVLLDMWLQWSCEERAPRAPPPKSWEAYLRGVLRRFAFEYRQKSARSIQHLREAHPVGEPEAPESPRAHRVCPEEAFLTAEATETAKSEIEAASRSVDPRMWRVFVAHEAHEVPVKVIAYAEQIPLATVYNRLRIARRDLAAQIRRSRARSTSIEGAAARLPERERAEG